MTEAEFGTGSPPRGRGRPGEWAGQWTPARLTPARAGTAPGRPLGTTPSRAHPRAGGDGRDVCRYHYGLEGSPPRGRGRPQLLRPGRWARGLTPARAGTALVDKGIHEPDAASYFTFRARRRLLAALQPGRIVGVAATSSGRRMRRIPSKSTGSQSWRCTRKSRPWSPRRLNTIRARPSLDISITRDQSSSRTFAEMRPQKTPGAISKSHRVTCPRKPTGHAVSTRTTTVARPSSWCRLRPDSENPKAQ